MKTCFWKKLKDCFRETKTLLKSHMRKTVKGLVIVDAVLAPWLVVFLLTVPFLSVRVQAGQRDLQKLTVGYTPIAGASLPFFIAVEEKSFQKYGLEVVYSKPVKPRGTMYLPILQEIATKKADVIWFISSWFTDTEVYTKQWADSAAKNIPTVLYGGVAQTQDFWRMTGGKGLGIISMYCEGDIPFTEKTLPFIALGKKLGIPLQIENHLTEVSCADWIQADRRFVQDVEHAAEVRPQLRRQPDALALATGKRRHAAAKLQIAEAHLVQKFQPLANFWKNVARNRR